MAFENFPYTNFHEINLDWIIARVKEAYSASNPPDYPVKSVNGMTGDVIIAIPANLVQSVNGETGDVILYRNPLVQFPTTDESRWNLFRICDGDARGIEFDEDGAKRIEGTRRILIYDEENQPDFPVTSVNGQTGDVRITAGVNSVNGKTGNVVTPFINPNADILTLDSNSNTILWGISRNVAGGNVALYISRGTGTPQAFIRYTPNGGAAINLPLLSSADIPESAGVVSVNGKTGAVTLTGDDLQTASGSGVTINATLSTHDELINALYSSVFEIGNASVMTWEPGSYRAQTGEPSPNPVYIRTADSIPDTIDVITSPADVAMALLAWENETYRGVFTKETEDFSFPISYTSNFYKFINVASLRKKYPTYSFRLSIRNQPQDENIQITEAEKITTYSAIVGGDVGDLEEIVATHSQQINALQAKDATHDQQITALQAADSTHDQQIAELQTSQATQDRQITALQAADSTHEQQISELQSADATHDQQISAIQAKDNTQDQQISELYTRTGIYVVSISNANTLPLRFPASGTDAKIKDTNKVVSMDLSFPGAQMSDWTITTSEGYLEITGTIGGQTDITLYLA